MMFKSLTRVVLLCGILCRGFAANATVYVVTEVDQSPSQIEEPSSYDFNSIPAISANDLVNGLTPTIVGTVSTASGGASKLTDGVGAAAADSPPSNFFWDDYTAAKKIIFDLGSVHAIAQVNSYSWHHGNGLRAPQDFRLFASTGNAIGFDPLDFNSPGWIFLAAVDSEIAGGPSANAGQHGVSVADTTGSLGNYQFVGLDVNDPFEFSSSFYSEIDVIAGPRIDLIKAVKPLWSGLTLTTNYQMQLSADMSSWTNHGAAFTATNTSMVYPQYFEVGDWDSLYFRLQVVP